MSYVSEFEELPEAMVKYLAARLAKVSKHSPGHAGQKYRARARRRGTWGKVRRRRALARQRLALTSRTAAVRPVMIIDEVHEFAPGAFEATHIRWQEPENHS